MLKSNFFLALLLFSHIAAGQIQLLKDINNQQDLSLNAEPDRLVEVDGTLYFHAKSDYGSELWKSDGTQAGTVMVKDVESENNYSSPFQLTKYKNSLFFNSYSKKWGSELWKSDGTEGGTVMVKDVAEGSTSSNPSSLLEAGGILFFTANDNIHGVELWKTDGTETGTVMVKDIYRGSGSSGPGNFTNANGIVYFTATNGQNGTELWKSDGTETGTVMVRDIRTGRSSTTIGNLTSVNGSLYFTADDGMKGPELWKSDGTEAGTLMVKDIWNAGRGSSPKYLTNVDGTLFFSANDGIKGIELWKSDGTEAGTNLVKNINPVDDPSLYQGSVPTYLTNVNGTLYFSATSGVGLALWKSDGTETGTVMVKDNGRNISHFAPKGLVEFNGVLYFSANGATADEYPGVELWKSDGTEAGTVTVKDINKNFLIHAGSSNPFDFINIKGTLFFTANDGIHGRELWKTDGTDAGTVIVKDIYHGTFSSDPQSFTNINGTTFFTADDGIHGRELWKSDGTEEGTVMIKDINQVNYFYPPRNLTNVAGILFFGGNDGVNGGDLWKSDGTEEGTMVVKDISNSDGKRTIPNFLTNVNGTLFFTTYSSQNGIELWKSDGTESGTIIFKSIYVPNFYINTNLINISGTLFFTADDGINGIELWVSDGTESGTTMVKDISTGSGSTNLQHFTNVEGLLYFTANDEVHGTELWKSDGTEAGTVLVKDIFSGSSSSSPENLTNVNGTLFFSASNSALSYGLWKSDGTEAGTVLVKDIDPENLTNGNGTLYFTASDNPSPSELWKSDGTEAGTVPLKHGFGQSLFPSNLTFINSSLYFLGAYEGGRFSIYKFFEEGCSTVRVSSNDSVDIHNFSAFAGKLFISGTQGSFGKELFLHEVRNDMPATCKRFQTITFDGLAEKTYGEASFNISATSSSGLPVRLRSLNPAVATITGDLLTIVGAGVATISATQDGNEEYVAAESIIQNLFVNKALLIVNAEAKSITYGEELPEMSLAYSGFVKNDTPDLLDQKPRAVIHVKGYIPVGTYPIAVSGGLDINYSFTYYGSELTVLKAPLSVRAENKTKVYGEENPDLTLIYSGFVNGDGIINISEPTISSTASVTGNIGEYPITLTGGSASNYDLSFLNGTLTVTKAVLTVTADAKNIVYGDPLPMLTKTYSGFLNSETETVITGPSLTTAATVGSDVGVYDIKFSGGSAANYELVFVPAILTISKAPLTVIADDQSKIYGQANPPLTITYSGFVNDDEPWDLEVIPSIFTTATELSDAGDYSISPTAGRDINYDFNYQNGNFTINKALLTVAADDKSRAFSETEPEFSLTYSGFLKGEDKSVLDTYPVAGSTAGSTSRPGTYSIEVSGGSDNNYTFHFIPGTLTISNVTSILRGEALRSNVLVYPNPTNGKIVIVTKDLFLGKEVNISLMDLKGKLLLQLNGSVEQGNNKVNEYLEDANGGVYLLQLKTPDRMTVKRIIKR